MDLAQLLSGLGDDDDEGDTRLTDDQIVNRLRDLYAQAHGEEHTFTPGQIIIHKFPAAANTKNADEPAMFIRYLEKSIDMATPEMMEADSKRFGTNSAAAFLDCVIAKIARRGTFDKFLADSREYRPHPDFLTD